MNGWKKYLINFGRISKYYFIFNYYSNLLLKNIEIPMNYKLDVALLE